MKAEMEIRKGTQTLLVVGGIAAFLWFMRGRSMPAARVSRFRRRR